MSLFLTAFVFATADPLLYQAKKLSSTYADEVAKAPEANRDRLTKEALQHGSVFFTIDKKDADQFLTEDKNWGLLHDLGIESVQINKIKNSQFLGISPEEKKSWDTFSKMGNRNSLSLLGTVLGRSSPTGSDFELALTNTQGFENLYKLVEIPREEWALLPIVAEGKSFASLSWLDLQTLYHKGFIHKDFSPYLKETSWNTTNVVRGIDGKERRWIYLKEGVNHPLFAFLAPSFSAEQIICSDALSWIKEAGTNLLIFDGNLPLETQRTLSLWIRKMGGFSAATSMRTVHSFGLSPSDLIHDDLILPAVHEALGTQNTKALRALYSLYLKKEIRLSRLIHALHSARKNPSGEDNFNHFPIDPINDSKRFKKIDLLLTHFYAMQPGVFSLSFEDLFGLVKTEEGTSINLYPNLSIQRRNEGSFARGLQKILNARSASSIAQGDLIDVIESPNPGTLLLLFRLPNSAQIQLLGVNFSEKETLESIHKEEISRTTPIDLITTLTEEKTFSSSHFSFNLPPMSGKAILFKSLAYE